MEELSLRDIVLVLRRQARLVVGLPLALVALVAASLWLFGGSVFEAEAILSLQLGGLQSQLEDKIQAETAPGLSNEEVEKLAYSRPVLAATLARARSLGAVPKPPDTLEDFAQSLDFRASPPAAGGGPLVSLRARAPRAEAAAITANAWAEATLEAVNRLPAERKGSAVAAVTREVERAATGLALAERRYREFVGGRTLALDRAQLEADTAERPRLVEAAATARRAARVASAALAAQKANLAALRDVVPNTLAEARGEREDRTDALAFLGLSGAGLGEARASLERQVETARSRHAERALALARLGNADPARRSALQIELGAVREALRVLELRREQIALIAGAGGGALRLDNPNPEFQRLRSGLNDLVVAEVRHRVEAVELEARARALDGRIATLRDRVALQSVQASRVEGELALARNQHTALSQKLADLRIEQASSSGLAQLLIPAYAPADDLSRQAVLKLTLAAVAGLVVGLVAAFVREALREPGALEPGRLPRPEDRLRRQTSS